MGHSDSSESTRDHLVASYVTLSRDLFGLLLKLRECEHVSSVLNRLENLVLLRWVVDEDCRVRRMRNGLPEVLPTRDSEKYGEIMKRWEESIQEWDGEA